MKMKVMSAILATLIFLGLFPSSASAEVTDIMVMGYNAPYDGEYHSITVLGNLDSATVTYSTDGITYYDINPKFKEVISQIVFVKVEKPGKAAYIGYSIVEITKTALTVIANNETTTYGAVTPDFSVTYDGFVLNESTHNLMGTLEYDCNYTIGGAVGVYDIMPKGLSSENYDITFVKGKLTVTPAKLIVTADDKKLKYLDKTPTFTALYDGFTAGDDEDDLKGTLAFDCDYVRGSSVGAYSITPGGVTSDNYQISFVPGTLTVGQLVLKVRFKDYDGTLISTDRVVYGRAADAPEDPLREGYYFIGWDRDFDVVRTNMTVTATYAVKTYLVTFEDYDGTVLAMNTAEWNTAVTPPADPERDGYTFIGWDSDFSVVTKDITVTAQYLQNVMIKNELIPHASGFDDDTVIMQDDGVPLYAPANFTWWWVVIGVGANGLLLLLVLFLVTKYREQRT